jgi:capsid protein
MAEGWDYTDPVSEAQADLLQIDMGIKTRKMAAAERGRDWEEMQIQLKAETAARKLNELPDVAGNYTRDRLPQQDQQPAQPQPQTQDGDNDGE